VVRSALVSLPGSYWGTGRERGGGAGTGMTTAPLLSVPWGRPDSAAAGDGGGTKTATAAVVSASAQIVPLGRASGSRVSRILEGSMDGP
jgi:hypothetical protein